MSGLVNTNLPLSFVALTFLCEPFRITGHMALFRQNALAAAGGLAGLECHIDDEFALARLRGAAETLVRAGVCPCCAT
jgi:hypothetical protein